jgi:hypothetical protein
MATVLEKCNREEQCSVVICLDKKDSMQRVFINKCLLFTVGSACSLERFTTWSRESLSMGKAKMCKNRKFNKLIELPSFGGPVCN